MDGEKKRQQREEGNNGQDPTSNLTFRSRTNIRTYFSFLNQDPPVLRGLVWSVGCRRRQQIIISNLSIHPHHREIPTTIHAAFQEGRRIINKTRVEIRDVTLVSNKYVCDD